MAERKLTGGDVLFFIDPAGGTSYSLVVCLTAQSIGGTTDEIDAATKCGPDTQPGKQKTTVSFEGQIMIDPVSPKLSSSELFDLWQNKTQFGWKYGVTTPATGDVTYSGKGFLSEYTESADLDNPATFTATVGVLGSVTKVVTP